MASIINKIDNRGKMLKNYFNNARGLANNKVDFNGTTYQALKSTSVQKYFIQRITLVDTDFSQKFSDEMVILPRTVKVLKAALKPQNIILLDRIYYLLPINKSVNLKFILGVLNSSITNFWFEYNYNSAKVRGNYFDLNGNQIDSIPIPNATNLQQQPITTLVDCILAAKKSNPQADTSALEHEIDQLVYKLYGLTEEETEFIKNYELSFRMSGDE